MAFLNSAEIRSLNFAKVGQNVKISDKASFYNCSKISIGTNCRIDDFCVISAGIGGILIGDNTHIAVYTSIIGAGKVALSDYCNLSSRVSIFSSSDDYTGMAMTSPQIPPEFTNVKIADVFLGRHVIVGSGSVILPGTTLEEGVAIGALSLVNRNCKAFGIYAGIPVKFIKERKKDLLELEKRFIKLLG